MFKKLSFLFVAALLTGCFEDPGVGTSGGSDTDMTTGMTMGETLSDTTTDGSESSTTLLDDSTSTSTTEDGLTTTTDDSTTTSETTTTGPMADVSSSGDVPSYFYVEDFEGDDGVSWPDPWNPLMGVVNPNVNAGVAQFSAVPLSTGTMNLETFLEEMPYSVLDFNAEFSFRFSSPTSQRFWFWGRYDEGDGVGIAVDSTNVIQNGGCIRLEQVSGGVHFPLSNCLNPSTVTGPNGFSPSQFYRVRLEVRSLSGTETLVQTKVWRANQTEPGDWMLSEEVQDASFQGQAGSFAIDLENSLGTSSAAFDDFQIEE